MCIWHTPLEGTASNLLEVHDSNGNLLDYQSIMLKRGQPRERHDVTLLPGQSQSATAEYAVTSCGAYTGKLVGSPRINGLPDSNPVESMVL